MNCPAIILEIIYLRSAQLLKLQIYTLTALKNIVHGTLRRLSGGRYGRPVVSLQHLATQLEEV